ncbi:hypothetical protein [Deinococcus hopiensis]|nr:hypothetical protein [Deinococcus hopiensis]
MKRFGLLVLATTLLASCSTTPTPAMHSLTVTIADITQAMPVLVWNATRDEVVFDGSIAGSKVFANLPANEEYVVLARFSPGYSTVPASQKISLTGDKTITLVYAVPVPGETNR